MHAGYRDVEACSKVHWTADERPRWLSEKTKATSLKSTIVTRSTKAIIVYDTRESGSCSTVAILRVFYRAWKGDIHRNILPLLRLESEPPLLEEASKT